MILPAAPPISVSISNVDGTINGSPLSLGKTMHPDAARQASVGNIPTNLVPMPFEKARTDDNRSQQQPQNQSQTSGSSQQNASSGPSSSFIAQALAKDSAYTPQLASNLSRAYPNNKNEEKSQNQNASSNLNSSQNSEAAKQNISINQILFKERYKDQPKDNNRHLMQQRIDHGTQAYHYTMHQVSSNI